jgi:peptide subunit release factor 1 (eRF1)
MVPLIAALDEYERYCVALVDKESARILTVWMGRIEQRIEFEDDVPGRSAMGNWAQARYARHREYHVHLHMQRVIDELWHLSRRQAFDRLIIGGPEEAMATLRPMLPRSLEEKVVGEFTGERFASDAEIVERVRGIEERAERAHETALVEQILERAPKRARAVLGWEETLVALSEGSVHALVLVEGATTPGFSCPEGHMAVLERIDQCPFCEEPMWPVDDLAVTAARLAMTTGATVEFVRGDAAQRLRPHVAGALLRY